MNPLSRRGSDRPELTQTILDTAGRGRFHSPAPDINVVTFIFPPELVT